MATVRLLVDSSFVGRTNGIGVDTSNILTSLSDSKATTYEIELRRKIVNQILIRGQKFLFAYFGKQKIINSENFQIYFQSQVGVGIPSSSDIKWIVRIHDIFPITNPKWFTRSSVRYFRKSLKVALDHDASLLFNSNSTKAEFEKIFPDIKNKSMVWFCSEQELYVPLCEKCTGCKNIENIKDMKYFLSVGTLEPRKNYLGLIECWRTLPKNFTTNYSLIIIGKYGWKTRKDRVAIRRAKGVNVLWIDSCCSGALKTFYLEATAFISNGFNEGFDIPALEARNTSRLPLILRDVPVHREIHKKEAYFFSDENSLKKLLLRVEELERPELSRTSNLLRNLEDFLKI
jgi:glycosyltransferase involved in cell wall biosynthesis